MTVKEENMRKENWTELLPLRPNVSNWARFFSIKIKLIIYSYILLSLKLFLFLNSFATRLLAGLLIVVYASELLFLIFFVDPYQIN